MSFRVKGGYCGIMGPNGRARPPSLTTDRPTKPTRGIFLSGSNISGLAPHRIIGFGIARPSEHKTLQEMTVSKMSILPLRIRSRMVGGAVRGGVHSEERNKGQGIRVSRTWARGWLACLKPALWRQGSRSGLATNPDTPPPEPTGMNPQKLRIME